MAFGIDDAVAAVAGIGGRLIDRLWPDPAQAADAKIKLLQMQQNGELAQLTADTDLAKLQIQTNDTEAANASLLVAGWRPAIGWVCAAALTYQYVLAPIGVWGAGVIGHPIPAPPKLDDSLWQLMLGMLGLGGLRTFEKVKGVASTH